MGALRDIVAEVNSWPTPDTEYPRDGYIFLVQVSPKGAPPSFIKIVADNEREAVRALSAYGPNNVKVIRCLDSYLDGGIDCEKIRRKY